MLEASLNKLLMQDSMLSRELSWSSLLNIKKNIDKSGSKIKISVIRNHSFEFCAEAIEIFSAFMGVSVDFEYSKYDDHLVPIEGDGSINIVWVDCRRYAFPDEAKGLIAFLVSSVQNILLKTSAPIVIVPAGLSANDFNILNAELSGFNSCYALNFNEFSEEPYKIPLYSTRLESITGTPFSRQVLLQIARRIAFSYIPLFLNDYIKAVVFDLDNTLHRGVLMEDQSSGLFCEEEFELLHEKIRALSKSGIFIALATKNNEHEVLALLGDDDYPLNIDDFVIIKSNFSPKSQSIREIAAELNIGVDSILFVDDNPNEIFEVLSNSPETRVYQAAALSPQKITDMLEYYPGLNRLKLSDTDLIRIKDIKAKIDRTKYIVNNSDIEAGKLLLKTKLQFYKNDINNIQRLSDLSKKTNQYNFSFSRLESSQISARISDFNSLVLSVRLSDRFSDSGIIALIIGGLSDEKVIIDEVCISCRAMGRGIDKLILEESIKIFERRFANKPVYFKFIEGPKNHIVRDWIMSRSQALNVDSPIYLVHSLSYSELDGVEIEHA